MPSALTRQGLDPARASHWRALLSALDERARASGGYRQMERPLLFSGGFPAATGGPASYYIHGSFLFRLAAAIRAISARYFDLGDFDRANAAHPPQNPTWWSYSQWYGVRCPVDGPPDTGLALGSKAMARFMERCADAIEAMECVEIGRYGCAIATAYTPATGEHEYFFVAGGDPAPFAAPVQGEVRAFSRKYDSRADYLDLGTGLAENAWTSVGAATDGSFIFPPAHLDPPPYLDGFFHYDNSGFAANLFLFPSFTPIQPPGE